MSLEEALAANTAALIANTAALTGQAATPAKATKKAAAAETPAPAAQTPAAAPVAAPAAPGPSFKEVADALVELVTKKDRATGVALLAEFGATKAPELKPTDYALFVAKAKAMLAPAAPATDSSGLL